MKQLLILSGKGGTGKTTVASAFIHELGAKVFADCDVDAPNLHITTTYGGEKKTESFYGLPKAEIDWEKCISCGKCMESCRFDAITKKENYQINTSLCEGCGVCRYICPNKAITMKRTLSGETAVYKGDNLFSTAKLTMGAGASGKLVTKVKRNLGFNHEAELAVLDGSPGIGCPVIASMSGVDLVLIVTEPTVSGISDLKRILKTAIQFRTQAIVCINKYDINMENTAKILKFCEENEIKVVGKIPFDQAAVKAVNEKKSVVEFDCEAARAIKSIIENTVNRLKEE